MLAKINTPFPNEKPWIVAANPLRFGAHNHGELTAPPVLGADAQILDELIPTKPIDPKTDKKLTGCFWSVCHRCHSCYNPPRMIVYLVDSQQIPLRLYHLILHFY